MALFPLQPTLDDGPSCVPLSNALMQNQFKPMKDEPFLTFVTALYPRRRRSRLCYSWSISSSEGGSTISSDSIVQKDVGQRPQRCALRAQEVPRSRLEHRVKRLRCQERIQRTYLHRKDQVKTLQIKGLSLITVTKDDTITRADAAHKVQVIPDTDAGSIPR
ncbi:hypothetical protein EDB87DRAFT_1332373 [Lactarius vividus]|nr:hypothetical protein EDB87DRAFT_1332373 [Lactarius vividus]